MPGKTFLIFICLVVTEFSASATDYYISNAGSAANAGTSAAAPWRLQDFNAKALANVIGAGDRVLFNRGEVFRGTVVLLSGTSSARIIYSAYGAGPKPSITGADIITGWTQVNGLWEATAPALITHLFANGKQQTIARYPNAGYIPIQATSGNSITNATLNQGFSWTGADVRYRRQNDYIAHGKVVSGSGGTIQISGFDGLSTNRGFFLMNVRQAIDAEGEWFQDPATLKVYYKSSTSPAGKVMEGSVRKTTFSLAWAPRYFTIDNLMIKCATERGLQLSVAKDFSLTNIDFRNNNWNDFKIGGVDNDPCTDFLIDSCTSRDCNNAAFETSKVDRMTMTNNDIRRSGMTVGYEPDYLNTAMGALLNGMTNSLIQYNIIDSTGYSNLVWNGNDNLIQNNRLYHNGFTKNDNGFMQAWGGITFNNTVKDNICAFAGGNVEGLLDSEPGGMASEGIYFDDYTHDNIIIGNTVYDGNTGIFIQSSKNFTIQDNTVYNCRRYQLYINEKDPSIPYSESAMGWTKDVHNINVTNNIFFANNSSQTPMITSTDVCDDEQMDFGIFNNNYYFNPYRKLKIVNGYATCSNQGQRMDWYTLPRWKVRFNQDLNSKTNDFLWPDQTVTTVGQSLVTNGSFDTNTNGWGGYQTNFTTTWVNNVPGMTGGVVKIINRETSGDFSSHTFPITINKKYVVKFKIKGSADNIARLYIAQQSPFNFITSEYLVSYDGTITDVQYIFTAPVSSPNAKLMVLFRGQDDAWMDDFSFYEVNTVTPVDYAAKTKLYVNETKSSKSYTLPANTYKDLDGNFVSNFTLQPFKSKIVTLNSLEDPAALNLDLGFENNFTNWSTYGTASINTTTVRSGGKSGYFANGGANYAYTGLTPGQTYVVHAWIKPVTGTEVWATVSGHGGPQVGKQVTTTDWTNTGDIVFTMGAGKTTATLGAWTGSSSAAYFDDYSIQLYSDYVASCNVPCESSASGAWNNVATWSCGHVPLPCNQVAINPGHVVTLSQPVQVRGIEIRQNAQLVTQGGNVMIQN